MMSKPDYSKPVKGENIGYLLSFIGELEHREFSKLEAFAFQQPLDDMTLGQALKAVIEWHRTDHGFNKIEPWNINDIVRSWVKKKQPTEAQIAGEIVRLGFGGEQAWLYRRLRVTGVSEREAQERVRNGNNSLLSSPKPAQRRVNNRHVARQMQPVGSVPLGTIINQNHKNSP